MTPLSTHNLKQMVKCRQSFLGFKVEFNREFSFLVKILLKTICSVVLISVVFAKFLERFVSHPIFLVIQSLLVSLSLR